MQQGFCLKCFAIDDVTKVFINVCSHTSVGLPLTKGMSEIPSESIMDTNGVDNLMIPISVGDAKFHVDDGNKKVISVDVCLHPAVVSRCVDQSHPLKELILSRVCILAIDWVQQECGIQINKKSGKVLQNVKYKHFGTGPSLLEKAAAPGLLGATNKKSGKSVDHGNVDMVQVKKKAEELYAQLMQETSGKVREGETTSTAAATTSEGIAALPPDLMVDLKGAKQSTRGPMVMEMPSKEPAVKKGFLLSKGGFYGESNEGILPEGAGDPLGYIPKSLREKCKIVDTRPEAIEAQQKAAKKAQEEAFAKMVGLDAVTGAEFLQQLAEVGGGVDLSKESRSSERSSKSPPPPAPAPSVSITEDVASEHRWETVIDRSTVDSSRITVTISVPETVANMRELDLSVEEMLLEVCEVKTNLSHKIRLPCPVVVDSAAAKFVKSTKKLIVTMTVS